MVATYSSAVRETDNLLSAHRDKLSEKKVLHNLHCMLLLIPSPSSQQRHTWQMQKVAEVIAGPAQNGTE